MYSRIDYVRFINTTSNSVYYFIILVSYVSPEPNVHLPNAMEIQIFDFRKLLSITQTKLNV